MRIRQAVPGDGPGIARVRVTTWRAAYTGIIAQSYLDALNIETESVRWSEGLARWDPARCAIVAEREGASADIDADTPRAIAGYVMGGPNRDEDPEYSGELYAIYVLPEYQSQGVGKVLFRAMMDWLAEKGHQGMILYVLRDNAPSRRFYEAMGGRAVREQLVEIGGQMLAEVGYGYRLRPGAGSGADQVGQDPAAG